MDYLVVLEHGPDGYVGAYCPDLPGLGVVGETEEEALQLIREGVPFHIEGLRLGGDPVPNPTSTATVIHVAA